MLWFRGQNAAQKKWNLEKKMLYNMKLSEELHEMYSLVNMLFILCMRKNIKLIMENPYSEEHFLRRYWCYLPKIIDKDRRENGDYFKKPTQYWFLNCEPSSNFLLEPIPNNEIYKITTLTKDECDKINAKTQKQARSMIHPQYASRFIRQHILTPEQFEKAQRELEKTR